MRKLSYELELLARQALPQSLSSVLIRAQNKAFLLEKELEEVKAELKLLTREISKEEPK